MYRGISINREMNIFHALGQLKVQFLLRSKIKKNKDLSYITEHSNLLEFSDVKTLILNNKNNENFISRLLKNSNNNTLDKLRKESVISESTYSKMIFINTLNNK